MGTKGFTKETLMERNKLICQRWLDWYDQDMFKTEYIKDLMGRLTKEFDLTQVSIYQILKDNQELIQFHKGWEKIKRITELKRLRADKTKSNKDIVDILDQERREIEGDKPMIDQSQHRETHIVINKTYKGEEHQDRIHIDRETNASV